MAEPARERYEIEIRAASRARRVFGPVIVLVMGLLSSGTVAANPGGRRFVIRERGTGQRVATHREPFGDDGNDALRSLELDLDELSVEEFGAIWVTPKRT